MHYLASEETMAQVGIREYDAKVMRHRHIDSQYQGFLYEGADDADGTKLKQFATNLRSSGVEKRVVKPDQLFGKRGKHGLLGISLSVDEVIAWIQERNGKEQTVGKSTGIVHTFLAEPLVPHEEEYYVSFETDRLVDRVNFSIQGGVEIEEVWESVRSIELPVRECHSEQSEESYDSLFVELSTLGVVNSKDPSIVPASLTLDDDSLSTTLLKDLPTDQHPQVTEFITNLVSFARTHGLTYLEVNPFVIKDGQIQCLDMVAKVDTCESWKQGDYWKDLQFVKPFGNTTHPLEEEIDELDAKSYASVQFRIMNPNGRIGLLLGGGGASVVVMDKLATMGLIDEVINYGDLSGNPSYGDNKAYIEGVIKLMLESSHSKQYLCYMGGIANFTKIDVFCAAYSDALTPYVKLMKQKNIHCIIRRGGPGDSAGLARIGKFLSENAIPHTIADGDEYLTTVLESIQFSANG